MENQDILKSLTLDELVGQTLCIAVNSKTTIEEFEEVVKTNLPGGLFFSKTSAERIKLFTDVANKYVKIPVIVSADVENGPEMAIEGKGYIPHEMAWGACDDDKLIEKAGIEIAKICRKNGVHWTFSPVVDINYNFRSPATNIRAVSDSPKQVVKICKAYINGIQKGGYMAATCKHFPGEGMDERNAHFVTTLLNLSKEEWLKTYGYVYKELIDAHSVMVGHTAIPSIEDDCESEIDALPAVLSKNIITGLLKETLGFKGVVVSDAMSMIGVASRVDDLSTLCVRFLNNGGDMVLFPDGEDFLNIKNAVENGALSIERLKDAVSRIITLKQKVRLFEDQNKLLSEIKESEDFKAISQEIADKSIKVVRDYNNIIPTKLEKGSKILMLNMIEPNFHVAPTGKEFSAMKKAFEDRGYLVDSIDNAKHKQVQEIIDNYDMVLLNCKMSSVDYHGGSMRVGWNNIMVMWRAYVLQHKRFIFTSFGDPYKIFDFPYLKEYINAFSNTDESQVAVVKIILGEIEPKAKNPVEFKPYFNREV